MKFLADSDLGSAMALAHLVVPRATTLASDDLSGDGQELMRNELVQIILQYFDARGFTASLMGLELESGVAYNDLGPSSPRIPALIALAADAANRIGNIVDTADTAEAAAAEAAAAEPAVAEAAATSSDETATAAAAAAAAEAAAAASQALSDCATGLGLTLAKERAGGAGGDSGATAWERLWRMPPEVPGVNIELTEAKAEKTSNTAGNAGDGNGDEAEVAEVVVEDAGAAAGGNEEDKLSIDDALVKYNFIPGGRPTQLQAASIPRVVVYMTSPTGGIGDLTNFMKGFLTTYRLVCTPAELLELLIARHAVPAQDTPWLPGVIKNEPAAGFQGRIVEIQRRVLNIMKRWLDSGFDDFDAVLLRRLSDWVAGLLTSTSHGGLLGVARQISAKITALQSSTGQSEEAYIGEKRKADYVKPFADLQKNNPTDIPYAEMARQLTLRDWVHFSALRPSELLKVAWEAPDANVRAPHMNGLTSSFNETSTIVQATVLKGDSAAKRAEIIAYWIRVARELRIMGSFHSMQAILAGLSAETLRGLTKSWNISKNKREEWEAQQPLLDNSKSYANLRREITAARLGTGVATRDRPLPLLCIPYIGMYCTDLVFIEEANEDAIAPSRAPPRSPKLPNIFKCMLTARVIQEVQQCQSKMQVAYEKVPAVWRWLDSARWSEKELMQLSSSVRAAEK